MRRAFVAPSVNSGSGIRGSSAGGVLRIPYRYPRTVVVRSYLLAYRVFSTWFALIVCQLWMVVTIFTAAGVNETTTGRRRISAHSTHLTRVLLRAPRAAAARTCCRCRTSTPALCAHAPHALFVCTAPSARAALDVFAFQTVAVRQHRMQHGIAHRYINMWRSNI